MLSALERLRAANRSAAKTRRRSGVAPALVAVTPHGREAGARRATMTKRQRLADAIARCTRRDRVVLGLVLVEGLTPAEAADAMGISVARLQRAYGVALAELRRAWRGWTGSARPRLRRAAGSVRLRKAV
jgi:DNA-directed RNA polymerase specialized sigma24 family protein